MLLFCAFHYYVAISVFQNSLKTLSWVCKSGHIGIIWSHKMTSLNNCLIKQGAVGLKRAGGFSTVTIFPGSTCIRKTISCVTWHLRHGGDGWSTWCVCVCVCTRIAILVSSEQLKAFLSAGWRHFSLGHKQWAKGLCLLKGLSLEITQKRKIKHQRSRVDLTCCMAALWLL